MHKIFFYDPFILKRSRLATRHFCPAFGWSGYRMIGTGIRSNPKARQGLAFGWVLYSDPTVLFSVKAGAKTSLVAYNQPFWGAVSKKLCTPLLSCEKLVLALFNNLKIWVSFFGALMWGPGQNEHLFSDALPAHVVCPVTLVRLPKQRVERLARPNGRCTVCRYGEGSNICHLWGKSWTLKCVLVR
jgi:hypothetical protein